MNLLELFAQIDDPRAKRGTTYQIKYILLFSIFALLSGATGYVTIARWIRSKYYRVLKPTFNLKWTHSPTKSTIQRILSSIDVNQLENTLRNYSFDKIDTSTYLTISIDGKTLRGSHNQKEDQKATQLLSLIDHDSEMILAHIDLSNKESEIPKLMELLKELNLKTNLSTDALHTQKKL
jgi:DDE_Tnp_1-associated